MEGFKSTLDYSFIVPVYNEKENIFFFIKKIEEEFDNFSKNYEIIFVDDNSPDGTAKEIQKLSKKYPKIRLLQHGARNGLGAAVLFGYTNAKGNYIVGMDVDLSVSPTHLPKMINLIEKNNLGMIIGSRYLKKSEIINKSILRKTGSVFFNFVASNLLKINLSDPCHSFRILKKEVVTNISKKIKEKEHPSFFIELTYIVQKDFSISEYPIKFVERNESQGKSKLSIKKGIISYIKCIIRLYLSKK